MLALGRPSESGNRQPGICTVLDAAGSQAAVQSTHNVRSMSGSVRALDCSRARAQRESRCIRRLHGRVAVTGFVFDINVGRVDQSCIASRCDRPAEPSRPVSMTVRCGTGAQTVACTRRQTARSLAVWAPVGPVAQKSRRTRDIAPCVAYVKERVGRWHATPRCQPPTRTDEKRVAGDRSQRSVERILHGSRESHPARVVGRSIQAPRRKVIIALGARSRDIRCVRSPKAGEYCLLRHGASGIGEH